MNQREFDFMDMISILSLALGYENLLENRQQSAQNDIGAANDAQARFMLEEINRRFENQNQVVVFKCCGREWTVSGEAATFDRERGCFYSHCPKCGGKSAFRLYYREESRQTHASAALNWLLIFLVRWCIIHNAAEDMGL